VRIRNQLRGLQHGKSQKKGNNCNCWPGVSIGEKQDLTKEGPGVYRLEGTGGRTQGGGFLPGGSER